MTKKGLVDLVELVNFQTKEQYKTLMILGPANCGKTKFAKLLAVKLDAEYIDMLVLFVENEALSKSIDTFTVSCLKKYLLGIQTEKSVVIVDNVDFLVNTWSEREKEEFLNLIDKLRSNETKMTFCFFMQEEDVFNSKRILNSRKENRVIHINQVANIKEISM